MITCNSCGELMQVGLANCQHCGMPLYSANQGGTDQQKNARGQSELPTWLESLRVNERPNSPASEQSYFSMADLIDEGALPSWMRPENAEMMEKGNSGKYPAWRPASMSAPHTDEGIIPPEGLPARSLIDEQSLPSWVQATTGAMPVTPDRLRSFSAANLIQPDDLPDWMKSLPQSSQPSASHLGSAPQGEPSGLNTSSLLDTNSLPSWLREEDQMQRQPGQMQASPSSQSGQIPAGSNDLSGASLIDANALPGWLRSYEAQQQADMQSMGNVRPPSNGTPPRVESVRVPSRPRGEMASHEQSEVAANVFSSVLGVASSAPYFPSAGPGSQLNAPSQNVMVPSQGFQAGQPQPPAGTQWNVPFQPSGFAGVPPAQGFNPVEYQGGLQGAYPGGYAGYMAPGGSPVGAQSGMTQPPPVSGPGMPAGPSMAGQQSNINASGSKPAKRGFIETIRSWFS